MGGTCPQIGGGREKMNEGGTAMKYSVRGKVREKVACASQPDLIKMLLSRFNLTPGAVIHRHRVIGTVILCLLTSVLFAGWVEAVPYQPVPQEAKPSRKKELDAQERKRKYQPVPQEAEFSQSTMTAPTALRKIREGL